MKRSVVATAFCMIFTGSPAVAQLALPGAVAPGQAGAVEKVPRAARTPKAAAAFAPPDVAAVVGRPLLLNGANGGLQFSGGADALRIDRLTMLGEVISNPTQQCRIDVGGGAAIETKPLGRPDGLLRFSVEAPACPFEFDILDGAVLVAPQLQACVFKEADCQASPSGLWGPAGNALGAQTKQLERARSLAEAAMVADYRALSARLSDPAKVNDLARDQSRFSSDREETCRGYSQESAHSFCATRLTEARTAFLRARIDEAPVVADKGTAPAKRKRKPPPQAPQSPPAQ
jgi:hypothetical protein